MPDEKNQITLESEFTFYNPRLPFSMNFPGPEFCGDNGDIMMIVGIVPEKSRKLFEVVYRAEGLDEAFHVAIDIPQDVIKRWGVAENITQVMMTCDKN